MLVILGMVFFAGLFCTLGTWFVGMLFIVLAVIGAIKQIPEDKINNTKTSLAAIITLISIILLISAI
jgi:hypothetical protein